MKIQLKKKQFLIRCVVAALVPLFCGSVVSATTIVTQYQYNPNGDWFGDPPVNPDPGAAGLGGSFSLVPFTTNPSHVAVANMYNYATDGPITDSDLTSISVPTGISGPGLNFILQNRNKPLDGPAAGVSNFGIRQNNGRFALRTSSAEGGGGMSLLGWSTAANTSLNSLRFALSIGPSGGTGGNADWEDGMRIAIQDTNGNWFLSNWASNGMTPVGGTAPATGTADGLFIIDLENETFAPFTPATTASSSLVSFDAGSATFAPFSGEAQAFGFYVQDVNFELPGGATEFRMRFQGFQVTVPEPGTCVLAVMAALPLALVVRRGRKSLE